MRHTFVLGLIALWLAAGSRSAQAQEAATLPTAEAVLNQYVEATGGKAAYEKFKNRVLTGTVELVGANIEGKIQILQAAPNQLAIVSEIGPIGKTTQATDGSSAWEISATTGERLLDGAEKDAFLRDAKFNGELHVKELYDKIECVGIEDLEGKPAYKLVLTPKTGKPATQYYDKASHLLVKETATTMGPMGEITADVIPSDYKRVDGILMPFTITQKVLSQQLVIKLKEVKHDADIPADVFKRPKSLDDAKKKKAA